MDAALPWLLLCWAAALPPAVAAALRWLLLCGGCCFAVAAALPWLLLCCGGCCSAVVAALPRVLLCGGCCLPCLLLCHGCFSAVAALRWLLLGRGCCSAVAAALPWLLLGGGCCSAVVAALRGLLAAALLWLHRQATRPSTLSSQTWSARQRLRVRRQSPQWHPSGSHEPSQRSHLPSRHSQQECTWVLSVSAMQGQPHLARQ